MVPVRPIIWICLPDSLSKRSTSTQCDAGCWESASQNPATNSSIRAVVPLSSFSSTVSIYAASCDTSINIFAACSCAFQLRARVGLQLWYSHTVRRVTTLTSLMVNVGHVYLVWEDIF